MSTAISAITASAVRRWTPRIVQSSDERLEHRPPGGAEDVGGDAVELDPGVLEDLVALNAIQIADLLLDAVGVRKQVY